MTLALNIASSIKQQIMVALNNLKVAGQLSTIYEIDANANPLSMDPATGYPFAVVSMPRVEADFEDSDTDMITYRFDVLFVINPEELNDTVTGVETIMDSVLSEFNQFTSLTLQNTAVAAVLPITVESVPVSTGDKTFLCFVATIKARALYNTRT